MCRFKQNSIFKSNIQKYLAYSWFCCWWLFQMYVCAHVPTKFAENNQYWKKDMNFKECAKISAKSNFHCARNSVETHNKIIVPSLFQGHVYVPMFPQNSPKWSIFAKTVFFLFKYWKRRNSPKQIPIAQGIMSKLIVPCLPSRTRQVPPLPRTSRCPRFRFPTPRWWSSSGCRPSTRRRTCCSLRRRATGTSSTCASSTTGVPTSTWSWSSSGRRPPRANSTRHTTAWRTTRWSRRCAASFPSPGWNIARCGSTCTLDNCKVRFLVRLIIAKCGSYTLIIARCGTVPVRW